MKSRDLEELSLRKRAQIVKLAEISQLNQQLGEAMRRQDEASVQILLSMRAEPIQRLESLQESIHSLVLSMEEADAVRAEALLSGAEPQSEEEALLHTQVLQFRRQLEAVLETDRRLSLSLGGNRSFYKTFR